MPSPLFALPAMLVVLGSFFLVIATSWRTPVRLAQSHLFAGNSLALSISSGIGSLFSMSLACTAVLSIGNAYGLEIIYSAVPGAITGALLLARLSRSEICAKLRKRQSETNGACGASYVAALAATRGRNYAVGLGILLLLLYTAILGSELAVARVTLSNLLDFQSVDYLLVSIAILAVCYSYVYIGGYRGVLITDHLQLLVMIGFFGLLCYHADWGLIWMGFSNHLGGQFGPFGLHERILLHLSSFSGAAFLIVLPPDNWIRTVGTLNRDVAVRSVYWAVGLGTVTGCCLILVGTSFASLLPFKSAVAGQVSLELLKLLASNSSAGISVSFFAALTCVLLTTLDTFVILQQQLYFEVISRSRADSGIGYLAEYLFRWSQIRVFSLVLLTFAAGVSLLIGDQYIYSFGTATMSLIAILTPAILIELLPRRFRKRLRENKSIIPTVCISFAGWLAALVIARSVFGPISTHLYILVFASGVGALSGVAYELSGKKKGEVYGDE